MHTHPLDPFVTLVKHQWLTSIEDLLLTVSPHTLVGLSVHTALRNRVPVREIAQQLYSQSRDNRALVVKCIGESLMVKIEKVCAS